MPTYDYVCSACGHAFEQFQEMSAKKLRKCPRCSKRALERQVGTGAGLIFKGTGFYITDYRKTPAPSESGASDTKSGSTESVKPGASEGTKSGGKGDAQTPAPAKAPAVAAKPAPTKGPSKGKA